MAILTKSQIRSKILLKLRTQKEEDRRRKSFFIKQKLFSLKVVQRAKTIMFYVPLRGEVDTKDMILAAQKLGKKIAVPVCKKNRRMEPKFLHKRARLAKGPYGVYEPVEKRDVQLEDINLVVVPGVAFDKKGNRLGRGKGYYDKFLKRLDKSIASIGLAFDFQILPSIPIEPTDVKLTKVIFA